MDIYCPLIESIEEQKKKKKKKKSDQTAWIQMLIRAFVVYICAVHCITKTCLFKYLENFTSKNRKFSDKKSSDIFHISAQNLIVGTR